MKNEAETLDLPIDDACNDNSLKPRFLRGMFENSKDLTNTAKLLEERPPVACEVEERLLDRKKRLKKKMRKINKRLDKLTSVISSCPNYQNFNIPVSLIDHIDSGQSPYTWLQNIVKMVLEEQAKESCEHQKLGELYDRVRSKTRTLDSSSTPKVDMS